MRHEALYLADIIEAADHIADFTTNMDFDAFLASELVRSAVVQKLAVIGEAASRVTQETKKDNDQVPWAQMIAFRNILIHAYFGTEWNVVWSITKQQCPVLREQVADILRSIEPYSE